MRRRATGRLVAVLAVAALALTACTAQTADTSGASSGGAASAPTAPSDVAQSGAAATSFTATTLTGVDLDVATFAGSPLVLWFWAPWCTICRAEAPDVAGVVADLDGQVTFLGVPGIGKQDAMRAFVEETGTGGFEHVVDDDGSLWQRFGVISQPAFAFIAPDGTVEVFAGALGADELRERAQSLVVKG
ncbi:MAG: redoxin domain-containing protein [Cellulomonas sp.]